MEHAYEYWLPDAEGKRVNHSTETNSVIIVGANGTGKSRLGAWMEQQEIEKVHRIGAQRNINISEHIQLKTYSDASRIMLYGGTEEAYQAQKTLRWNWGRSYTTQLLNDFDDTLAALIALHNNENQEYVLKCRSCENQGETKPNTPMTPLDRLLEIWNGIFPERELLYHDGEFSTKVKSSGVEYPAREMSDGERSVLYLASQVLAIPSNKGRVIIMDEPEVHLNRSLLNPLWSSLESARDDCLFIYITHDVDFATSHPFSDKVWVEDYDGKNWKIVILDEKDLPEPLLIRLLGNRRQILFVEGEQGSLDYAVYSAAYPECQVVPVGGCSQVIENVKAFRANSKLHDYSPWGIIDRDYRSTESLDALEKTGIHHLRVAEIENLFLAEPVMRVIAKRFAPNAQADDIIAEVKKYVVNDRFMKQLPKYEKNALNLCLKNELSAVDASSISVDSAETDIRRIVDGIELTNLVQNIKNEMESIKGPEDYEKALVFLNEKGLVQTVGHFFGLDNKQYVSKVVSILGTDDAEALIEAMKPYLPVISAVDEAGSSDCLS